METIIEILEKSVAKHGVIPLTNSHLLNIIKLANKIDDNKTSKMEQRMDEALMEIYADQCCDRD
jgi:hypothetical protein